MTSFPSMPGGARDTLPPVGAAAAPVIRLRDVSARYGSLAVVERVSLDIRPREIVSFIGPSGCGKSTLLRAIAGLVPLCDGEVRIDRLPPSRHGERRMTLMFQKPLLLPWRTVLQNICLPMELAAPANEPAPASVARAQQLIQMVRLDGFERHYPHQLSGGMQQRVAIARALMAKPQTLLMDEPFGALDEITRDAMNEELLRLWHDPATALGTVVMVTHSITEAVGLSDRIVVFSPRPASIVEVIEVDHARPRDPATVGFQRTVAAVRQLIREHR